MAPSMQPQSYNQWTILNSEVRVKKSLAMFNICTVTYLQIEFFWSVMSLDK